EGVIFSNNGNQHDYHKTDFSVYDVSLNLAEALGQLDSRDRDPSEIPMAELRGRVAELEASGQPAYSERVELTRRFSVPFAALVFALRGIPLGLQPVRAVRSRGLAVSLIVILVYYLMLSAGETLGEQGRVPIALALWAPNILLGAIGTALFLREAREIPWPIEHLLASPLERVRSLWAGRQWKSA